MRFKLQACPFCGGEAKMSKYKSMWVVECSTCGANIQCSINLNDDPDTLNTRDEVMEAWNLRDVESKPERTCRRIMRGLKNAPGFVGGFCSECEHPINEGAVYCEHCGAKVIEE